MPLHWTIDSRRRTIDIVAEGAVSVADAMAFFDAIEGAEALAYSKLLDGTRAQPSISGEEMLAIAVRIRAHHAMSAVGALAVVANPDQTEQFARVLGALAVADRPLKVFEELRLARRWLEAQPPQLP